MGSGMNSGLSKRQSSWMAFGSLVLSLSLLLGGTALAAESSQTPPIKEWQKTLDGMETRLQASDISDEELQDLRQKAQKIRDELGPARTMADEHADLVRRDLEALGPAPEAGQPLEAPGLRAKRQSLMDQVALAEATGKETELTRSRLDRVVEGIKARRRERFAEEVLTRVISPLNPMLWAKAIPDWIGLGVSGVEGIQSFFEALGNGAIALMTVAALIWQFACRRFHTYLARTNL